MDRDSRTILIALVAVLAAAALGLAAATFIPFNVDQPVTVLHASGEIEQIGPGNTTRPLTPDRDTRLKLKPGQGVQVKPDGSATLAFDLNGGRAILNGPAALRIVDSYRRATLPGQATDSVKREYVLTLEQTGGTVHYNFEHTTPPLDEIAFTLRLPDQNFVPTTPCWIATISAEGTSSIQTMDCSS